MKFTLYEEVLLGIKEIYKESETEARNYQKLLAKPLGSLGELEEISCKLAAITGNIKKEFKKKEILIFAADNGVFEEGIATTPQEVTLKQAINMTKGLTGVCALAKVANASVEVIDVGINSSIAVPGILDRKIKKGTNNFTKHPAMSEEDVRKAITIGIEAVLEAKNKKVDILGIGEMGIGNTTTSSAVLASLLELEGEEISKVVGRGAGLSDEQYENKIQVIRRGIQKNMPNSKDPLDVLSKVGGFDLAAMCGAFLGAAYCQIPVVIDGFISVVAALCACKLNKKVASYLFASHKSYEKGYQIALEEIGIVAYFELHMRLGEGSGCPLFFQLVDSATSVVNHMATFEEASIDREYTKKLTKEFF